MPLPEGTYGLMAEFETPTQLVHAAKAAHGAGYRRMDCYTPYPVEEAAEAIGFHRDEVSLVCLLADCWDWRRCSRWRPGSRSGPIR